MNNARLLPRHFKILDLYMSGSMNYKQIAEEVGVSPMTVHRIVNMPNVQKDLSIRRNKKSADIDTLDTISLSSTVDSARRLLEESAEEAAERLVGGLVSSDERIVNKSANDLLDRVGISRVSKQDIASKSTVLILDDKMAARIQKSLELDTDDET